MGIVQLNQIKARISTTCGPLVDICDVTGDEETARLTRGLAAWALTQIAVVKDEDAASAATFGSRSANTTPRWACASAIHVLMPWAAPSSAPTAASGSTHQSSRSLAARCAARTARPSGRACAHTQRSQSAPSRRRHPPTPRHRARPGRRSPATNHRTYERSYLNPVTNHRRRRRSPACG